MKDYSLYYLAVYFGLVTALAMGIFLSSFTYAVLYGLLTITWVLLASAIVDLVAWVDYEIRVKFKQKNGGKSND